MSLTQYSDAQLSELLPLMTPEERANVLKARKSLKLLLTAHDPLSLALHQCIEARKTIPAEQKKIDVLIRKADKTGNAIEQDARRYQKDLIAWQLNRAADVAQKRIKHISDCRNWKREKERIADGAEGAIHFFRYYAWGFDPRADSGLSTVPLYLFDTQEKFIEWLERMVFLERTSGVAPKSRDMGATVICCDWSDLKWLVVPGFAALLSSRKDDLVDSMRNPDTLFEKCRMQLRLLPKQLMPESFDWRKHSSQMMLANPENGSVVTGEAPVRNFGRQQRATVVFMDEFAAWPDGGYAQKDSVAGGTSRSIIEISSVKGKFNQFYEDWSSKGANVFPLHWKDHPWKDERWYNALPFGVMGPKMSKALIAQEIDMDPEASQPGRVWGMWSEIHTVITMSELRQGFARHGFHFPPDDGDGRPRVPANCLIARLNDRGATEKHRNAWLWAWRPREHEPFADTVFLFREWLAPIGATFRLIVDNVRMFEMPDDEDDKIELSLNSHEAESERVNYEEEYDLVLTGWKTDYESGIAQISEFLTVIDTDKDNPWRYAYPDKKGNPVHVQGRTRLVIVAQDGQGELKQRENGSLYVEPPRDHLGMLVTRRQIPGYHYAPEEAGKPVQAMRPQKIDDDVVDCCFVAGTLITTRRGLVPIEQVTNDDDVLTRDGWQSCSGAWKTRDAEVLKVTFSDGRALVGTAEHPVWVQGKGFIALDCLRTFDIVHTCEASEQTTSARVKWWNSTASAITATLSRQCEVIASTIRRITQRVGLGLLPITLISGSRSMATYPPVGTSTTKTITRLITTSRIWNVFPLPNTCGTITSELAPPQKQPISPAFDRWRARGTEAPKGGNGIARTARLFGITCPSLLTSAIIAGSLIKQKAITEENDGAHKNAKPERAMRFLCRNLVSAWNVLTSLTRLSTRPKSIVPLSVVSVEPTGTIKPVYNLSVYNQPEYFANGVLVHNCRALAIEWGSLTGSKTESEELADKMKALNPGFAPEEVAKLTGWERQSRLAAIQIAQNELNREAESGRSTGSPLIDYQERLRRQGYL